MIAWLLRHRDALVRMLGVVAIGAPVLLVALAITVFHGDWPRQRFLLVYTAPLFVFGAAWARARLRMLDQLAPIAAAFDAAAFVLGAIRIGGGWGVLPYSGHMLFLTYVAATTRGASWRMAALGLLGMTTWYKLGVLDDRSSWAIGLACGLLLSLARASIGRNVMRPADETSA